MTNRTMGTIQTTSVDRVCTNSNCTTPSVQMTLIRMVARDLTGVRYDPSTKNSST